MRALHLKIEDSCHCTVPAFHNPHQIKRPQPKGTTVKRPAIARPAMPSSTAASSDPAQPAADTTTSTQQPGIDYWRSTADDDAAALDWRREVEKEKREKKKQEKKFIKQFGWWKGDAPYKPDRPSNLRAYKASGGYRFKMDSFAEFLQVQATLVKPRKSRSEESSDVPSASSASPQPPAAVSQPRFAPPANYDHDGTSKVPVDSKNIGGGGYNAQINDIPQSFSAETLPSPPPPPTAPEPYSAVPPPPPPPPAEYTANNPPPPPPADATYNPTISAPPVRYNPTISAPPVRYNATISAPPVRYDVPETKDQSHHDERPAKRPKISKAEAMMAKMGYVKGKGLGKNNDGITTHLEVKARKGDKRVDNSHDFDDENGKTVKSQQVFDILGGHITKRKEPEQFGQESKVIVTWGCVDDVDWTTDAEQNDGGIRQVMGQTFDDKFGAVERIYVNLGGNNNTVYIKFTSELSALNVRSSLQ